MRTRPFGRGGPLVPVIGLGTWQMELDDRASAVAALRRAVDLGATHIDTAELYGDGRVEEIVAEALAGRRDEVFLVSKVLPRNADREGTVAACERSLRRLRTDHLDSYLLHWPGPHPLEETFAGMEALVAAGHIRSWGVSNFDADLLRQALSLAPPGAIRCNQVLYHLEERAVEHDVLPLCAEAGVQLVAYSPFGSSSRPWGSRRSVLDRIAAARGVTAHAVALAFLLRDPAVHVIPKTSNAARVDANVAGDLDLTAEELAVIDAAFPRGPRPAELPTI